MRFGHRKLGALLASSSLAALLVGTGAPAAFAQCAISPGTNQPSVSNSAAINCINIDGITVTGDVTNTGTGTLTATGAGQPSRTGITINNASVGGAVTNAGHITATSGSGISGNGIFLTNNAAVSGGIANSGKITARAVGIFVDGFVWSARLSRHFPAASAIAARFRRGSAALMLSLSRLSLAASPTAARSLDTASESQKSGPSSEASATTARSRHTPTVLSSPLPRPSPVVSPTAARSRWPMSASLSA